MDEIEFNRALNESAQLLRQNRPGEAETRLLPLYETSPDHPDVLINLSGAYILQSKWDKAVKLLNKGAKANPNNAMLWMNLGAAQLGRLETAGPQQQERAIQAYQRALQANPETPNAHYSLGLIYKERGELTRAAAFFQRALEVDPADRDARYWLDRLPLLAENTQDKERHSDAGDNNGAAASDAAQNGETME
jgi:tetratricopeptide (TPR) repeat protein